MIKETNIRQKNTSTGVYLFAKTEKGQYGQHYNLTDKSKPNYVGSVYAAKRRFMRFYNNFEAGKQLVSGPGFKPLFV